MRLNPAFIISAAPWLLKIFAALPLPLQRWLKTRYHRQAQTGLRTIRRTGDYARGDRPPGIGMLGLPFAQRGIGEHIRLAHAAAQAAAIPHSMQNYDLIAEPYPEDHALAHLIGTDNPYSATLLCLNPPQITALYDLDGAAWWRNYRIGYGYWELAQYPQAWRGALNLLDEVWAPTRFIRQSVAAVTDKPVLHMPIPVVLPEFTARRRTHFGLPENTFLFFFAFDLFSYIERKNPLAAVNAFRDAFPKKDEAGLVLKVSRPAKLDGAATAAWKHIESVAARDPRIRIIDRMIERGELLALMQNCDAYISLHRAEGFGLGMAEAMALGLPVIATGYSGNMDFTLPEHACVVDYSLVPVGIKDYPHAQGQVWAEPDVAHAARHMRELYEDREYAKNLGLKAHAFIAEHYSAETAGQRYAERLRELRIT